MIRPAQEGDRGHALISPSASSRWLACPYSLVLPGEPEIEAKSSTSRAAELGTIQHAAIEDAIRLGDIEGPARIVRSLAIDDRLIRRAWGDFHEVMARYRITQAWLETTVEPIEGLGDLFFGTSDCIGLSDDGTLLILDYKFGRWTVEAKLNPQLLIYAMGAARFVRSLGFSPRRFVATISQPARNPSLSVWEIEPEIWAAFGEHIAAVLYSRMGKAAAIAPGVPNPLIPVPGEHCNFCPKKATCPEHDGGARFDGLDLAGIDFD